MISDPDCERLVIACIVSSGAKLNDVRDLLKPECFTDPACRDIYEASVSIAEKGLPVEPVSLNQALKARGSRIGFTDIMNIVTEAPVITDAVPYARVLSTLALRRRIEKVFSTIALHASDLMIPPESLITEARDSVRDIFSDVDSSILTFADVYPHLQERMLRNRDNMTGQCFGTPTGFPHIDQRGGFSPSDLIVIGAETSQGKTSFATAIAVNAVRSGHPVAFYSMEMTAIQLSGRIAAMLSGQKSSDIMFKPLDMTSISNIDRAVAEIDGTLLYFDDRSTTSLDSILNSIRSMAIRRGIKGAVIDYLQLINVADRSLNREQATALAARSLKNLAKELNIWVIAISQLRRDPGNPIPTMGRLRDSGQIEEAADTVILIYRPAAGRSFPEPFVSVPAADAALVKVEKGRNIGTCQFIAGFDAATTTFYPVTDIPAFIASAHSRQVSDPSPASPLDDLDDPCPF